MRIRDVLSDLLDGLDLPVIGDLPLGKPEPRLLSAEEQQPIERRVAGWVARGLDAKCVQAVLLRQIEPTNALDQVRAWHRNRNFAWLRMLGGRGTGKSWAAMWWLMQGRQNDARLITGAEASRWWPRDERWTALDSVPRLVIDDPDIQGSQPEPWFAVLEARYRRRLPTILGSNAETVKAFWAWWGDGNATLLRSRWNELGTAITCGGDDMRMRTGGLP